MIKKRPIRGVVATLTTIALTVTGLAATAVPAYASTTVQATSTTSSTEIQQARDYILAQVNQERAKVGAKPVKANSALDTIAQECSTTQAANGIMNHCTGFQYKYPAGWTMASENVAYGYSLTEVMSAWMASTGHRTNILNPNATDLGIGYVLGSNGHPYYTQNFAGYNSTNPPVDDKFQVGVPTIMGVAEVGRTLYADAGNWDTAATLSYQWLANGVAISGQTGSSLTITSAYVDKRISIRVVGVKAGYSPATATSDLTAPVTDPNASEPRPVTSSVPEIIGTAKPDQTLTVIPGTWETGATLAYQWEINSEPVSNANSPTFKVPAVAATKEVTVTVTGSKSGYIPVTKLSDPVSVGLGTLNSTTPIISGTPNVGSTLTADPGTWTSGTTLTYQWYANNIAISGATSKTFVPTSSFVNQSLTVRVRGTNPGYVPKIVSSNPVNVGSSVLSSSAPKITGTLKVGSTLLAEPGTWTSGTTFKYQWYANNVAISGATSKGYVLQASTLGKKIHVSVRGYNTGYNSVARSSGLTGAVAAGSLTASTPKITGTLKVGSKLSAAVGTWTSGTSFKYQWFVNNVAVSGATASTYTPTAGVLNKRVSVRVTGSKTGYNTGSRTSAQTGTVAYGTFSAPATTIGGTPKVGSKIQGNPGYWGGSPTTVRYQWYLNGVAIKGATSRVYTPTAGTLGKKVYVRVTGSKAGYRTLTKTSNTVTIARGTLVAPTPKVSGTTKVGYVLTANKGTWTSGTSFKYQWYVNGKAIKGATLSKYRLTSGTRGKYIQVKVTGSKAGYTTVSKTSGKTSKIR